MITIENTNTGETHNYPNSNYKCAIYDHMWCHDTRDLIFKIDNTILHFPTDSTVGEKYETLKLYIEHRPNCRKVRKLCI